MANVNQGTRQYTIVQVDAFTQNVFGGNSAAVVILDEWLEDTLLQKIALENNLSETVYVKPDNDSYSIRWFTPQIEVDLCGHATLAAAYVMFKDGMVDGQQINFISQSGDLQVNINNDVLFLNFPARMPEAIPHKNDLLRYLGVTAKDVVGMFQSRDTVVVLHEEKQVAEITPDYAGLALLETFAVCVTAPGVDCDFVSRFFAPKAGINEDPVTGSAHCSLIPYWATRLNKNLLSAKQISSRVGELFCEYLGERVLIGGHCREYMRGQFCIS